MRLSTQTRLFVLIGLLVGAFLTSAWLLRRSHTRETAVLLHNLTEERQGLVNRLLELNGQSLHSFANDYSFWGEMVAFVASGDPAWARVNIEASLPNFGAHAAWVFRADGSPVYSVVREVDPGLQDFPVPPDSLLPRLDRDHFAHFYLTTASGLMEIRAAPVQPSEDATRTTPPLGWFVVGRKWDEPFLAGLRETLRGGIELRRPPAPAPVSSDPTGITLRYELPNWQGRPEMILESAYRPDTIRLLVEQNKGEMLLFVGFGLGTLVVIGLVVGYWVIHPLRALEQSLVGGTAAPLERLRQRSDEFGRLAGLVRAFFRDRAILEQEVAERRRAEAALRQSEEQLRRANSVHTRLARDLHDGAIQSIYAAGLGLEGVRSVLRTDPTDAESRLDAASRSLNQTIHDIRGFITGLEPEEAERPPFVQSLRTLLATLQSLHAGEIRLDLPGDSPPPLTPREEVHALQIVRECISNALRHGEARLITVGFDDRDGSPVLVVADDGRGFDPAGQPARSGGGLANISARATEIGARCDVDSAPGKGTRVTLAFSHTRVP